MGEYVGGPGQILGDIQLLGENCSLAGGQFHEAPEIQHDLLPDVQQHLVLTVEELEESVKRD